ncbi:hypothetical protein BW730_14040 [Tessaracoccus aquimaris]|uniref:Pyrrolo-quinoline quinone repeat domain-containing protein n=1 Tax=Tessaracoccus aquimaris TaxID=1332264 RepID=A0A1Q2CQS7_9ACTN|nr:PQQ-binding-like beta-propeller repeat protein [Tessaracoccus aquimaris]AQP48461.1 hypothetical protein BW730_14040 [Tessaracoccus aquimaris]
MRARTPWWAVGFVALGIGLAVAALIFQLGWVAWWIGLGLAAVALIYTVATRWGRRGAVIGCLLAAIMLAVPSLVIRIGGGPDIEEWPVALVGDVLVFHGPSGASGVSLTSGETLWEADLGGLQAAGGTLFASSVPGSEHGGVVDAATGKVLWTLPSHGAPSAVGSGTLAVTGGGSVTGYDSATGAELWRVPGTVLPETWCGTGPQMPLLLKAQQDWVAVSQFDRILVVDMATGEPSQARLDPQSVSIYGDRAIALDRKGGVVRVADLGTGDVRATDLRWQIGQKCYDVDGAPVYVDTLRDVVGIIDPASGEVVETDLETRGLEISGSMTRESVHGLPGRYRDGRVVDLTTGEPYPAMPGRPESRPEGHLVRDVLDDVLIVNSDVFDALGARHPMLLVVGERGQRLMAGPSRDDIVEAVAAVR